MPSYSDVFSISHDREHDEDVQAGDLVRTGPNLYPHFEVVAVHGDKAWLRNVATGVDSLTPLSRCRRLPAPALAVAAE
jgi:hypothetical protein